MRLLLFLGCLALVGPPASAETPQAEPGVVRVATYNVSLYRQSAGQLAEELATGRSSQASRLAEVVQRVRPDVLLLCEIDYDPAGDPPSAFADLYLSKPQAADLRGVDYPHRFTSPTNTGDPSGIDLDGDGRDDGPNDAWGFGRYRGQYGMAVLSRWPIDPETTRTFQRLLWSDLPDARRPIAPGADEPYHPEGVWRRLRLPSKSFWDVVIHTPGAPLHLICSHPTPPVFDGPEDRNGKRNADEIRLVTEYTAGRLGEYFVDDGGTAGALPEDAAFVVVGDLNADPIAGNNLDAINRLLQSKALAESTAPTSEGALAAAGTSRRRGGDPAVHTADFGRDGFANLRVDYALASKHYKVVRTGVFWPTPDEPGGEAVDATDHRLVWVDITHADDGE